MVILVMLLSGISHATYGQENIPANDNSFKRTPEEDRELFNYCEKNDLVKNLHFSADIADKIGDIDYWARLQKNSIDSNTNLQFATYGELNQELIRKYKALRISDGELKSLLDYKKSTADKPLPCAAISLSYDARFDTLASPRAIQLYKTKFRKPLIDKTGVNGRQADGLIEIEIWKQKECLGISKIPSTDFNRIRKTVAMHAERLRRCKVVGIDEAMAAAVIQFFDENRL
ncbi:MAG: hypothetical protein RLZZ28_232 [Bacteroidota bacterium]